MIQNNGYNFFLGTVVDIYDPEKSNRVKVRVFGLHDTSKADLPNDHLMWAGVLMSAGGSMFGGSTMTGIGTNHNLKQGATVLVTFLDGTERQMPLVMGSVGGIQPEWFKEVYQDPDKEYPKKDWLGEPDVHRIARNEKISETIIQEKRDTVDSGSCVRGDSWNEPPSDHNAKYPYNQTTETISGHHFESDDTPGAERIHWYHTTGTSREVQHTGDSILRVVGDNYEIVSGSDYIHIRSNKNLLIDGNCNITVKGDTNIHTVNKTHITSEGDVEVNANGRMDVHSNNEMKLTSDSNIKLNAPRIDFN